MLVEFYGLSTERDTSDYELEVRFVSVYHKKRNLVVGIGFKGQA
jgi:hypothetical protein